MSRNEPDLEIGFELHGEIIDFRTKKKTAQKARRILELSEIEWERLEEEDFDSKGADRDKRRDYRMLLLKFKTEALEFLVDPSG